MNTERNSSKAKTLTGLSMLLISIPLVLWGLWIYSFNQGENQMERVKIYLQFFPESLRGRFTLAFIGLVSSFIGSLLAFVYWNQKTSGLKTLSLILVVVGGVMLILSLFSLM